MDQPGRAEDKYAIVAATLAADGGAPELQRIGNTERAIGRFIDRVGGPNGLAVSYEAGRAALAVV